MQLNREELGLIHKRALESETECNSPAWKRAWLRLADATDILLGKYAIMQEKECADGEKSVVPKE